MQRGNDVRVFKIEEGEVAIHLEVPSLIGAKTSFYYTDYFVLNARPILYRPSLFLLHRKLMRSTFDFCFRATTRLSSGLLLSSRMAFYSYEILIAKNILTMQELNLDVSGLSTSSATNLPPPLSGPRQRHSNYSRNDADERVWCG